MSADAGKAADRPGGPGGTLGMLSLDDLAKEAEAGTIDTVVTAFTDMQGRLFGKRIQVEFFLEEVTDHAIEGCNYLLALEMDGQRACIRPFHLDRDLLGVRLPQGCQRPRAASLTLLVQVLLVL